MRPEPLRAAVVVAAADHGVAAEGVSAYPQEVTRQMLLNFSSGGAAVCVLARAAGADLVVVDAGVAGGGTPAGVRDLAVVRGTANATVGPAMTRAATAEAMLAGAGLGTELMESGVTLVALGEMGIANTTVAAALGAVLLDRSPGEMCGPGTGVGAEGVDRKIRVVERMLAANRPSRDDPLGCLAAVGGPEIAFLAGLALRAASGGCVVLLDGFITGVAALVAARLAPPLPERLVASHLSPEPGHRLVLQDLGLEPLLDLGLRLGEGSGAALALPLVHAARAILAEMATFEAAGVTDTGR